MACSEPKIDATSDVSLQQSLAEIREGMGATTRARFDSAVGVLALSSIDLGELFSDPSFDASALQSQALQLLDGKSGEQVIALGDSILRERRAREREQALHEIAELEAAATTAEAARAELARFEVQRSRFSVDQDALGLSQPRIRLTVRNGTEHAIARAYFLGTVASVGRSVPWIKEPFNYQIRGGIEPGETRTWNLAPNMFSAWGAADIPRDAVLTVEVVRLDGANGEPLFSTQDFDEEAAERLAELKEKYVG